MSSGTAICDYTKVCRIDKQSLLRS